MLGALVCWWQGHHLWSFGAAPVSVRRCTRCRHAERLRLAESGDHFFWCAVDD